ncbi:MAG: hypothetical protein WC005_11415 [Candidatus Nanopelagicales bacterium]
MNPDRRGQRTYRPISIQQRLLSAGLAAGVFVGIGGLIATRMAEAATATSAASGTVSTGSTAATAVSFTQKYPNSTAAKKTTTTKKATASTVVVHATTKASKGG